MQEQVKKVTFGDPLFQLLLVLKWGKVFFVSLQNVMNYFCELHTIIYLRKRCYDCIFVLQSLLALMYFLKN